MDYNSYINEAAQLYNIPADLLHRQIKAESAFNPRAKSKAGAMGLMQLMPGTAQELGVKNPYDPRENIMGGAKYFRKMLDMFGGDKKKALMAYNAGPGNVKKYSGNVPFKETQDYVSKIIGDNNLFETPVQAVDNVSEDTEAGKEAFNPFVFLSQIKPDSGLLKFLSLFGKQNKNNSLFEG